jgi:hypothetical protein
VGFRDVVVNDKLALRAGHLTSERPGRVLYGPAYAGHGRNTNQGAVKPGG